MNSVKATVSLGYTTGRLWWKKYHRLSRYFEVNCVLTGTRSLEVADRNVKIRIDGKKIATINAIALHNPRRKVVTWSHLREQVVFVEGSVFIGYSKFNVSGDLESLIGPSGDVVYMERF